MLKFVMFRLVTRWTWPALAAALAFAVTAGARWNEKLVIYPIHGQIVAGQASASGGYVYQRIHKTAVAREAEYGFISFTRDKLRISYRIAESDFKRYNSSYGYRPEELEALRKWRDQATRNAYDAAIARHKSQAELDAAAADIQRQYKAKLLAYLEDHGFRLEQGNTTRIDMRSVVRKNGPQIKPLARSFDLIARQRGYGSMDIIGAVLSFAQTAIKYKEPDDVYKGKHTGGILAPITTVVLGWGDCDTKTGLAASILSNWSQMRMIGISVPGHYLMGVLQIPDKGDMFVEYQGLKYVLAEPAGPAWLPPGRVAEKTVAQLSGSDGYRIYPFF